SQGRRVVLRVRHAVGGTMQPSREGRFTKLASSGLIVGIATAIAAACGSTESPSKEVGAGTGGSAGSSATGGTGGIGAVGGTGGSGGIITTDGGGDADVPPPNLPPPWQYFDDANEKGFKDPSLPDDVKDQ